MNGKLVFILVTVLAGALPVQATGILTVGGDNRSGTIQAYIQNSGDPVEAGYNIDPGSNEWLPISFDQTVNAASGSNTASAHLNSQSSFDGFNSVSHTFTSLTATSSSFATLHIVSPQSGSAQAQDYVSMGFHISGLASGQRMVVRLQGAMQNNGTATHSVALTGSNNVNRSFSTGAFNALLQLGNGDYTLLAQSNIQFSSSNPVSDTATAGFSVEFAPSGAGDLNCDGAVNFDDINAFVELLSNPSAWQAHYPGCPMSNGDLNGDGLENFDDIDPFVALLSS